MRIYRQASSLEDRHRGAVIAVGNFDGVHRGHRTVIGEAGRIAEALEVPWGVLTFEPHPRQVFQPDIEPFRLTPFREKAQAIKALGVDFTIAQKFDIGFSRRSAKDFVAEYLVAELGVRHVVAGYDFKFGHKRQGSCETLLAEGQRLTFDFTAVAAASDDGGGLYSSSRARALIQAGDMEAAAQVLGRTFAISGRVVSGDRRGREIGFPTANMRLGSFLRPAFGIYAVRVHAPDGRVFGGAANLGIRPMYALETPNLEVHVFDFDEDIYGQRLTVELVSRIRDEMKFDGVEALAAQIARDCAEARARLG